MSTLITVAEYKRLFKEAKSKTIRFLPGTTASARQAARGLRKHKRGEMNKLEAAYWEHLCTSLLPAGQVLWIGYESIRLKIADGVFTAPDFFVQDAQTFALELHEVKGTKEDKKTGELLPHMTEAARIRTLTVASIFPFPAFWVIRAPKKAGGHWIKIPINEATRVYSASGEVK